MIKQKLKTIISIIFPIYLIEIASKLNPIFLYKKADNYWKMFKISKIPYQEKKIIFDKVDDRKKVGIIIQGPIIKEDDFTYNTIKLLLENYKNIKIILSTWKNEEKKVVEKIKNLGIDILLNDPPINGLENLNLQIVSTYNGIKHFEKEKINYILKIRTDQRIYQNNTIEFFLNLLDIYPVFNSSKQTKRIIGIDINTCKYIPFSFSDMLQFGSTEDMEKMWNVELTTKKFTKTDRESLNPSIKEMQKYKNCEMVLCESFLKKTDFKYEYSLFSYYKALHERFLVVDSEMIGLYWFKYNSLNNSPIEIEQRKIKFLDWNELYTNFNNIDILRLIEVEKEIFKKKLFKSKKWK